MASWTGTERNQKQRITGWRGHPITIRFRLWLISHPRGASMEAFAWRHGWW